MYNAIGDPEAENDAHNLIVGFTGQNRRVLELGCATGSTTKVLKDRGCSVVGVEIDAGAAELAEPSCERIIVADLDLLDLDDALRGDTFDVIIAADVLEHLRDPTRVLRACVAHMRSEGEVLLSIPNIAHADMRLALLRGEFDYQTCGILNETHMRFFTRRTIADFLDGCGLVAMAWHRTVRPLGETEIQWKPPHDEALLEWIARQPDADTYKFVVRAAAAPEGSHVSELAGRLRQVDALTADEAALRAHVEQLEAELVQLRGQLAATNADKEQSDSLIAELGTSARAVQDRPAADLASSSVGIPAVEHDLQDALEQLRVLTAECDQCRSAFETLVGRSGGDGGSSPVGEPPLGEDVAVTTRDVTAGGASVATRQATAVKGAIGGLDLLLPDELRPDAVEAIYAEGWGYDLRLALERATLRIGETEIDAVAIDVERPDVAERHRHGPWQSPFARTSGMLFAGLIGPLDPGVYRVALELGLADGTRLTAATENVVVGVRLPPTPVDLPDARVAVVMATHNPPPELFERQIESIRAQQHVSWCCLVCDDASSSEHIDAMRSALGNDKRFVLIENERQVGFYLNFERALQHVPASVPYVALSDQDDVWHPAKLRRQCDVLDNDSATQLVASDARVVDASGRVMAPTFYARRRPTHSNPYSLFVVNSLIGASMLFRRELLALALPFPRAFPNKFHDHWLARSALIAGTVGFVDEPLHDYIQHGDNTFGSRESVHWPLGPAMKVILRRVIGVDELPPDWSRYFVDTSLEASIAAKLLGARWPGDTAIPWLDRVIGLGDGQLRELSLAVLDYARERFARRTRREFVEYVQVTGGAWLLAHRPAGARRDQRRDRATPRLTPNTRGELGLADL